MALDPQIEAMLASQPPWPGFEGVPVDVVRKAVRDSSGAIPPATDAVVAKTKDRNIEGPGGDLKIRIYTPEGEGPFPVILFLHGGGYAVGDLDTKDAVARALCAWEETLIVSVDYRLAPEHPFPAALTTAAPHCSGWPPMQQRLEGVQIALWSLVEVPGPTSCLHWPWKRATRAVRN